MGRKSAATTTNVFRAYTDGACEGNPGPGGFGAVFYPGTDGTKQGEILGAHRATTNNQMELMAAIALLESLPAGSVVEVHTDSRYVQSGISEWLPNWKRRNWRLKSGGAVKNAGLWRRLERAAAQHDVRWHWVRGHAGNHGNERADELARTAIKRLQAGKLAPTDLDEHAGPLAPANATGDTPQPQQTGQQPATSRTGRGRAAADGERDLFSQTRTTAANQTAHGQTGKPPQPAPQAPQAAQPPQPAAAPLPRPRLVLASTSPYRRSLLARLQLPFEVAEPGVDEAAHKTAGLAPVELARTLARQKATALAPAWPETVLVGGDQVVMLDGKALGKPGSPQRATEQLLQLAGRTHHLLTAVAVHDTRTGQTHEHLDVHEMTLRPLTRDAASAYIARDETWDCAGAYKVESLGIALFSRIHGDDASAIVGLPLIWLCTTLAKLGLDPLQPSQ